MPEQISAEIHWNPRPLYSDLGAVIALLWRIIIKTSRHNSSSLSRRSPRKKTKSSQRSKAKFHSSECKLTHYSSTCSRWRIRTLSSKSSIVICLRQTSRQPRLKSIHGSATLKTRWLTHLAKAEMRSSQHKTRAATQTPRARSASSLSKSIAESKAPKASISQSS